MELTKRIGVLALLLPLLSTTNAQQECTTRTFITNTSFTSSGFTVLTYEGDQLDSLFWDFGDGTTELQNVGVGTGAVSHTYAEPGIYTVTLERWGLRGVPLDPAPIHCTTSITNEVFADATDSLCGGDFLVTINGNHVIFSNRSVIHAPGFNSHSSEPLWDFGNGTQGGFINRVYEVDYEPGTYTACLYYGGFSFNDNGYLYDCETCQTFTVGGTQSVGEHRAPELELYPNPCNQWLELRTDHPIAIGAVMIIDPTGKVMQVTQQHVDGTRMHIDVSGLAQGAYHVRYNGAHASQTMRFIKM